MSTLRLLNVSNITWVPGRWKRNQAIFQSLLNAGCFSSGIFLNPPSLTPGRIGKYFSLPKLISLETEDRRITVLQPYYCLSVWHCGYCRSGWVHAITDQLQKTGLLDDGYVLWMNSIGRLQAAISPALAKAAKRSIFDSSDDLTSWEPPSIRKQMQRVLSVADTVVCVNEHVAETITHNTKIVFRNCTAFEQLSSGAEEFRFAPYFPKPNGSKYVGFIGGIHESRADRPLLQYLFHRFPEYTFLFVGHTDQASFRQWLQQHPNVGFIDTVPHKFLPGILRQLDVAIVPHRDNAVTRGNDLLKVLDYFACRVPVVTTRCSRVEEYAEALYIADSADEFGNKVEQLMNGTIQHDASLGVRIATKRSWSRQVPELAQQLFGKDASLTGKSFR